MRIFITGPSDVRMDEQKIIESETERLMEDYPDAEFVFTSFPGTEFLSMATVLKRHRKVMCLFPWREADAHVIVKKLLAAYPDLIDKRELRSFEHSSRVLFVVKQKAVENSDKVVVFHTDSVTDISAFTTRVAMLRGNLLKEIELFSNEQKYSGYFTQGGDPIFSDGKVENSG